MNKYEISLWEDFQSANGIDERKIGTIGTDKMTTWTRAREPKMVENINGTHTFSFKMFYTYIDEITGETILNPFRPYLINERKVKVFWQDEWYDLIIKSIDEDSSGNSAVYTCKDLFITELSKNGYNIELTSDLQNNSGTASDLTEQVLKGSGWRFNSEQSDKIYQYLEQPVYESVVSGSAGLSVSLVSPTGESGNITIPLSATILVLKSSLDGIKESTTESREVHVIYADDLRTEYNEMLVINGQEYKFTGNVTRNSNNTFTIVAGNSRINSLQLSTRYRAKGLVQSQKTVYDPLFERYVNIYSDNQGNKIYGFQTTEFSDPIAVVNLIVNPSNFKNTSGWIGQNIEWMIYPDNWDNVDMSTYNAIGYLKIPTGSVYNNGISANLNLLQPTTSELKNGDIGGFHVGDRFIFRAKVKNNLSSNSYVKTGFNFQICEFNNDYTIRGNSYFSSSTINPSSEWYEAVLTCTQSCPATELEKLGFFFTNSSNSVLYIEEVQFFKEVQGTDDVINYYTISQPQLTINIFEANGKTYSFYKESEAKTLIYLKDIPDGYTIEPSDGNGSQYWPLDKTIRSKANQSGSTVYNVINQSDNIISTFTVEINNETYNSNYIETVKTYVAPGEIYLQGVASVVYKYYNADQTGVLLPEEVEFLYIGEEESPNFTPVYTYEKITTVEAKGSNRFNILQSIAENFQCWIRFTINHDSNGKITLDSNGLPEKYITLVNDLGVDLGWSFIYGVDLKAIKRKIISEDIVTKTIVLDNNNEFGKNGFCSIARSPLNYARENFILNFDYYINAGLLDQDEVNADLYSTSDNHLGYLYKLNDWNNQYIESIEVLVQKKLELDKQSSELEVLKGRNKATLEEITSKESDIIKLAGTSTFSEAQQYVIDNPDNQKVQSLMTTIGQLRKDQTALASKIDNLEDSVENLRDYVDKQDAAQRAIVSTIKNLHDEFFKKYSRYIQEGVWQSEDYISDDKYYLDATEIAHTSAYPKVQYEISVIRLNALEEFSSKKFNVGDVCYIQDKDFFNFVTEDGNPYKLQIVISEITSYFDNPEKDVIKVQNYKTQFEDLFQRITATTQSLQYSQGSYARAADAFNSNGALKFDLLQQTFDNNASIVMNASNQDVIWDSTGITIKDSTNSAQLLRIMSGGLFVSNDGGLTWKNAVRGDGISTDVLTAGRINTGQIFILNDDYPTFRWDSNGITAYSWDNNGVNFNKFVRYDQYGLYGYEGLADFIPDDIDDVIDNATFGLTWDGFFMKSSSGNGAVIINSNDSEGKIIKGIKNGEETFWLKDTGDASFKGTIYATNGSIRGTSIGVGGTNYNNFIVDDNGNVTMNGNIVLNGNITWGDNVDIPPSGEYDDFVEAVTQYMTDNTTAVQGLQDNMIETYYLSGAPTLGNNPASAWTTNDDKRKHIGDLYFDKTTGYVYRFIYENNIYSWARVKDHDIVDAMTAANTAQDTADGKRRTFVGSSNPTPPYDVGDLWTNGTDLKTCINSRTTGQSFNTNDWIKQVGYTNDDVANSIANGTYSGGTFIDGTMIHSPQIYGGAILGVGANGNNFTRENQKQYNYNFYVNSTGALGIGYNSTAQSSNYRNFYVDSNGNVWLMGNIHMIGSIDWGSNTGPSGDADYDVLAGQIATLSTKVDNLEDNMVETYYYNYAPTLNNIPASQWTTNDDKASHIGDLFFNKETGYTYRFNSTIVNNQTVYSWDRIEDNDIESAMNAASNAQAAADGKIRHFITTNQHPNPYPPYDEGDIWSNGSDLYVCKTSKTSGSYNSNDWVKATDYTNDTVANSIANGTYNGGTFISGTTIYSPTVSGGSLIGTTSLKVGKNNNTNTNFDYNMKVESDGSLYIGPYNNNGTMDYKFKVTSSGVVTAADYIKIGQNYGQTNFVEENGYLKANDLIVNGTVYATDGSFAGEVKASSGNIGGWQVATGEKETFAAKANTVQIIGPSYLQRHPELSGQSYSNQNKHLFTLYYYPEDRQNVTDWNSCWEFYPSASPWIYYCTYLNGTNGHKYPAVYITISDTSTNTGYFYYIKSNNSRESMTVSIKDSLTIEEKGLDYGIPATIGFGRNDAYWNRFVPAGALYRPDYSDLASGVSGELFGWYPNNVEATGTQSDSNHKFEMVPWRGIYLSPVNNDKAYIKIPGSTATDGSNLKDDWRLIIGNNFGVDSTGTLYASNGNFSGTISSGTINAGEVVFQAYQNTNQGGGFKCATGNDGNSNTYGAMMYGGTAGTNYFIATNAGVRMTATTNSEIFCTSSEARIKSTNVYVNGKSFVTNTGAFTGSDRNKKHDISYNFDKYEEFYKSLKPSYFKLNDGTSNRYHVGFIAQDVESALLNNNLTTQDFAGFGIIHSNNESEYQALRYEEFISLNTYMIQKLMKQIEDLQQEIENLKQ